MAPEVSFAVVPAEVWSRGGLLLDRNYAYCDDQGRYYCSFCASSRIRAKRKNKGRGGQSRTLTCEQCGCRYKIVTSALRLNPVDWGEDAFFDLKVA